MWGSIDHVDKKELLKIDDISALMQNIAEQRQSVGVEL